MEEKTLLRRHQEMLLSMLQEIDRVCRMYDIPYMLFAGTALGAVRHEGFIPWDDDLDVLMLRPDYERFIEVAPSVLDGDTYYLQKEFSEHWMGYFSKLRRNGTACMEKYHPKDRLTHQGVYVDIFPCDNLSDHRLMRGVQFVASKVVMAHVFGRRGYTTRNPIKKVATWVCALLPLKPFLRLVQNRKAGESRMVHSFLGGSSRYDRSVYQRDWMTTTKPMRFEDGEFPVSACAHELLTRLYGDYRTLPSEDQRVSKQHVLKLDLDHSYEEYVEWQAQQTFDVPTRSIR
jgi:lipopolysaccharide cholinephosphotransferase